MVKSDFYKDTWIYRHPTKKVTDYKKFVIQPVIVYDNPSKKIKDRTLFDEMEIGFTGDVIRTLKKDYTVVDDPGPQVLSIQITVVDIKPIVRLKNEAGNDTIRVDSEAEGSKIEVDCHDSLTNEQIFAMSRLYQGTAYTAYENPSLAPALEKTFDDWLQFFKARLDEAVKAKKTPSKSR